LSPSFAAQQVAVGVELMHGAPAVVDRSGADGEIGVDLRDLGQYGR